MRYKATIEIYLDLDDRTYPDAEGALADGISNTMLQAIEDSGGFLIDWRYRFDGEKYAHAEPFTGLTPEEELALDCDRYAAD